MFGLAVLLYFLFGVDNDSSLLTGMDSYETIDRHTDGFMGCNTPNAFPFLLNPKIFSYHLVESTAYHLVNSPIFLYDSINSAVVCTQ